MTNLRLRFAKTGKAAYLSHLDLMRTFPRAFLRAGIKLRHTEGFNPHAYLSIALPLSVGMTSGCELLDFQPIEQVDLVALAKSLSRALPEGIDVLEIYPSVRKVKTLKWLSVSGLWDYGSADSAEKIAQLDEFFTQEQILFQKWTKKGEMREVDLKPMIGRLDFSLCGGGVAVQGIVAAQNPSLNPLWLVETLRQNAPELVPNMATFHRMDVLDEQFKPFH